jgi:hypothetical protein
MLKTEDLTFVVQGPVIYVNDVDVTIISLRSIAQHFLGSRIIFSTWIGQLISEDYSRICEIVLNNDPLSGFRDLNNKIYNNINRQLISTLNGLKKVETKYAIKVRSDILFENSSLLDYCNLYNKYDERFHFFKNRILVTNITTVNPYKRQKLPYHPCDWLYFGLIDDLFDLFDIPLFDEPEFSEWFLYHQKPYNMPFVDNKCRYSAENYIFSSFLRKKVNIRFEHLCDVSNDNLLLTEKYFANNLVVLHPKKLGIRGLKTDLGNEYFRYMYTTNDWMKLYNKYSNGNLNIPYFDREKMDYVMSILKRKLYNVFNIR